jgi:LysM repeat protein
MADLNKPSMIEDAPSAPEKEAASVAEQEPEREELYVPFLPGESLADFAARYKTTAEKVVERNKLNPDYIFPNQWVFV